MPYRDRRKIEDGFLDYGPRRYVQEIADVAYCYGYRFLRVGTGQEQPAEMYRWLADLLRDVAKELPADL